MKQAKRIIAMVLCLLALLALPAGAVMEKGEPNITAQTTMKEVRNNPGIKNSGFYTYSQDKDCPPGQALWEMTTRRCWASTCFFSYISASASMAFFRPQTLPQETMWPSAVP